MTEAASSAAGIDRLLLGCAVAGPVLFVVSFVVQGALRPGYDPLRHPISSLALGGPAGWVQTLTFLVTGLLVLGYAVGLHRSGNGWWAPALIGLVGLGLFGTGLFPCDPINGYPPGSPSTAPRTLHGVLHDLCSTPVFVALPVAALVMARRFGRAGARDWAIYSVLTAVVCWAAFVLSSLGFGQNPIFISTGGLWQRVVIVTGFGWLAAVAVRLLGRGAPP